LSLYLNIMSDVLGAVESALKPHIDEDTCDYIASLLEEDPTDEDAREAVTALIEGFESDNADAGLTDNPELCRAFFELLDLGSSSATTSAAAVVKNEAAPPPLLRKLDQAVTLSTMDVQTFASGLRADTDAAAADGEGESKIAAFYANMIDVSSAAQSERARRKARQKEIRERLEEEERQRAIQEAMEMFEGTDEDGAADDVDTMMEASADNSQDCHFRSFDLANLRGGGPNLLTNASLSLARGRRYGLMGRNGCGKTTFLTYVAARQLAGAVPKNMNMLLVRQEIMGNDWSAVETVVKSDVKRESVKRFISYCETELENLERGDSAGTTAEKEKNDSDGKPEEVSKAKQNMRERKRNNINSKKAASAKVATTSTKSTSKKEAPKEVKQAHLNEKLALAYQRLAEIEEEEGGDPEPRARKVLAGLGFSEEMQNKPTQELSGGWRMRVSLSCALFANPSLLLLDERKNRCRKNCFWGCL
jgi:ABC-type dipeptide/oligopeptide/nickel transport system ATPase subunit